ncbi:MAG: glycosyltransferase family 39 protein [Planctomycetaceae bacterium]|nr:glycosyltransferase family 39 protein [Planctomycetaceae bacterium]
MRTSRTNIAAVALLAVHAGLLAWSGYVHSPTLDEVGHLPGGLVIWQYGRFDLYRVNPPLPRAVAAIPVALLSHETDWSKFSDSPGARPEWAIGSDFIRANGERAFWLFTLARWACIPFSLLGGIVCWRWGRSLFGESAGLLALTLWCFCPNILGNGALVTPDVPAAALGVLAAFCFWRWLCRPTWTSALIAGASLGLAELCKLTWVVLFGLWPAIWLIAQFVEFQRAKPASGIGARTPGVGQLTVVLLMGLYVLNLGYAFDGSFRRLDSYPFFSRTLAGETRDRNSDPPGNRFVGTWLGALPVPLPYDYLTGMDLQKQDFEVGKTSYLRGEFKQGGWWYYYLYAAAVKLPLGLLVLIPVASWLAFFRCARLALVDALPLLLPPLVVFVLVSSQTGFNRYFRYVVPALPFVFIAISRVALFFSTATSTTLAASRPFLAVRAISLAAIAWAVASSLYYCPHSLSYFNEFAGGPRRGHDHLIDANIDWGQDLFLLREWIAEHPEARPLTVTYEGFFDPAIAGVDFPRTPAIPLGDSRAEMRDQLQPGWHAVSVSCLRHPSHMYDYLQPFEPVALAGYSIYVYRLTAEDVEEIRRAAAK